MRIPKAWLQDSFTFMVLFLSTGAFLTVFLDTSTVDAYAQGNPKMQLFWSGLYGITFLRALSIRHRILAVFRENRALIALMLLTSVSFCWSIDPVLTARRSLALILGTLFAVDFGARYSVRKQIQFASYVIGTAIVLSAVIGLWFPGFVPLAPSGGEVQDTVSWHGLFNHKNAFGQVLSFGVLCTITNLRNTMKSYIQTALCLTVIFALIAACQSRTSLVISLIIIVQWPLLQILHLRPRSARTLGVASILVTILGVAVCYESSNALLSTVDRTTDLTGRTEVWQQSLQSAAKRPILGYGYNGFWGVTEDSDRMSGLLGWRVPSAHNGFLDVYIQLGLVGFLLFLTLTAVGLVRAIQYARAKRTPDSLWPLASMLMILYNATTESYFLTGNSFTWFIFVSALINVNATEASSSQELRLASEVQDTARTRVDDGSVGYA